MNSSIQFPTDMSETMNEEELMKESMKFNILLIATLIFCCLLFCLDVFQKYKK